jgi:hypothetical protein
VPIHRAAAIALNLLLRLTIAYFLVEVILNPQDPRFAGKAIPVRNLIIVGGLSIAFPVLHWVFKRWPRYPVGSDNLYLSVFWLDMAGNSFDLYRRVEFFDLIPHFHGTGAVALTLQIAFNLPALSGIGLANIVHLALEAQEYYTDVLFGTQNVRGTSDVVNDLVAGLLASVLYGTAYVLLSRRRAVQPRR